MQWKGAYKLFENSNIDNQSIKKTDYKLLSMNSSILVV